MNICGFDPVTAPNRLAEILVPLTIRPFLHPPKKYLQPLHFPVPTKSYDIPFQLKATDSHDDTMSTESTITITLNDVNDNTPVFANPDSYHRLFQMITIIGDLLRDW